MLNLIIKPIVTEKATAQNAKNIYSFWVDRRATKIAIKLCIKEVYGVEVATVRIMNTSAKKRMARRIVVDKRPAMRKAIVTLKDGKKLDITKIGKTERTK